ncbi:hypothetical protein [Niabella soli]|uniref:Uncharacterized protein n=1 Tax=Niabella soli DSM 19437 TaxID=929713 RepID=W0F6U3_9BACT|nr:hypothetical protein [Niabella soli]AHF17548.1 hypothetical protein NIASO_09660 [Niabella soli DSM 19437]
METIPLNNSTLSRYLKPHSKKYRIETVNRFCYEKGRNPVMIKVSGNVEYEQQLAADAVYTAIGWSDIKGETDQPAMEQQLQQMLSLAAINRRLVFKRNRNGEVLEMANREEVLADWHYWVQHELAKTFTSTREQQKFVQAYQYDLNNLEQVLRNNFQYSLLLPEFLGFNEVKTPGNCTRPYIQHSRLLEEQLYEYAWHTDILNDEASEFHIKLNATLLNFDEVARQKLEQVYSKTRHNSIDNFDFNLSVKYIFKKYDGSITAAKLCFDERIHEHLHYQIRMTLEKV